MILETYAVVAAGKTFYDAISSVIPQPIGASSLVSGVAGNTAHAGASYAWKCFRNNWGRLDQLDNHILFRAVIEAHWRAVAQTLAQYGRARGCEVTITADKLPLPKGIQQRAARWVIERQSIRLLRAVNPEDLQGWIKTCDERSILARTQDTERLEDWSRLLDPLYDDMTRLMAQARDGAVDLGPADQAWQALTRDFPEASNADGLEVYFKDFWFPGFTVNFQSLMQQPETTALLTGKLFAEMRARSDGEPLDVDRLVAAFHAELRELHDHIDRVQSDVAGVRQTTDRTEQGVASLHQKFDWLTETAAKQPLRTSVPPPIDDETTRALESFRSALLATDGPERFASVGGRFLGSPLNAADVELVDI